MDVPLMNNLFNYVFRYRRKGSWFWKKKQVDGHKFEQRQNKMVLYFQNGGLMEIEDWKDHECKLGVDWVRATKESIKDEAGTS